ncbi:uncharacterized protein LOC116292206 [Actinia tenebrosa]|uniref:Uncharacterized protein LOC116292206 n=1 Tax=Actinia tenebrosa TaxID=6105 RepID=A0A6P8HRQ2_ACTTE|nr:uncharacterized protein LOC116292206 [Actinia tenebrosa]
MEVKASILSLNDDCLCNIVAFISDRSSFNSLARTCKRLQQLTSNPRNCHVDIVRLRAEHFIKRLVVHLGANHDKRGLSYEAYDEFCKFEEFLAQAFQYSSTRCLLTYDKVVDVWITSGPVASEVFTWVRNHSFSVSEGEPRATCMTKYSSFTVHLPRRNREMSVNTTYFHDHIGNYDDELTIEVKCDDLKIESKDFYRISPEDFKYWSEEEMKQVVESMKPVTDLLQEELGETIPSIHGNFLFWFLYFFPEKMRFDEEDKLSFKDAAKNEKPSIESIQPMLEYFQKNLLREFQTSSARWMKEKAFPEETETCKFVIESLDALVQRSDARFLKNIQRSISRIFRVITDYCLRKLPEKLMLALIKKTSFETDNFSSGATADKFVDNTVSFQLPESKFIKVKGEIEGDGYSDPTWHRLKLEFHLPDKKIHLDSGNIYDRRSREEKKLDMGKLSPVTKLLQECINHSMEGEEEIPKIKDMFTALYFIIVLDFGILRKDNFFGDSIDLSDLLMEAEEDKLSDE